MGCRIPSSGIWTDAATRTMGQFRASANNRLSMEKSASSSTITYTYRANSISKIVTKSSISTLDWFMAVMTWSVSADQVRGYFNGVQEGATQTGLGVWAGALSATNATLGSTSSTPTSVWSGLLAHAALWARALTAAEAAELARVN